MGAAAEVLGTADVRRGVRLGRGRGAEGDCARREGAEACCWWRVGGLSVGGAGAGRGLWRQGRGRVLGRREGR